jgi:hypothetical protein
MVQLVGALPLTTPIRAPFSQRIYLTGWGEPWGGQVGNLVHGRSRWARPKADLSTPSRRWGRGSAPNGGMRKNHVNANSARAGSYPVPQRGTYPSPVSTSSPLRGLWPAGRVGAPTKQPLSKKQGVLSRFQQAPGKGAYQSSERVSPPAKGGGGWKRKNAPMAQSRHGLFFSRAFLPDLRHVDGSNARSCATSYVR